jgi:hypothetical protein
MAQNLRFRPISFASPSFGGFAFIGGCKLDFLKRSYNTMLYGSIGSQYLRTARWTAVPESPISKGPCYFCTAHCIIQKRGELGIRNIGYIKGHSIARA